MHPRDLHQNFAPPWGFCILAFAQGWGYVGIAISRGGHLSINNFYHFWISIINLKIPWNFLIYSCQVFNNYESSNYKKNLEWTKIQNIFFVQFQALFSQKIINIHLYISYKAFICSVVELWWLPNDIYCNSQSPHWKTILFVESTKLFISNSVRVHRYICEII